MPIGSTFLVTKRLASLLTAQKVEKSKQRKTKHIAKEMSMPNQTSWEHFPARSFSILCLACCAEQTKICSSSKSHSRRKTPGTVRCDCEREETRWKNNLFGEKEKRKERNPCVALIIGIRTVRPNVANISKYRIYFRENHRLGERGGERERLMHDACIQGLLVGRWRMKWGLLLDLC